MEALTLREANELLEYWSEHPPTHVLLAAMVQARPLRKRKHGDLLSAVAGAGGSVSSAPSRVMQQVMKSEHEGHGGEK